MTSKSTYRNTYLGLPESLAEQYTELNFDNHCYLRIALDNALGAKWDTKIARPAYRNLTIAKRHEVLSLLRRYETDRPLLLQHNEISLSYRKQASTPKLF